MSNYLAIATVTAALQQILQLEVGHDIAGVQVTTLRPDMAGNTVSGACINIFLYQVTPNPAWRNADLRTRRPKGDLIKHAQAGLDLHYLFSFYGNEQTLEPQRLMGSTIRALVDNPLLTEDMIEAFTAHSSIPSLEDSTLAEQVQAVRFMPGDMTTDQLSRIWPIFFQVPYALSFPYQATAVLIQGEKAGQTALPVRQRPTYVSLARPVLKQVEHHPPQGAKHLVNTVTLQSRLTLSGNDLHGTGLTQIKIGKARVTPQSVDAWTLEVSFPDLTPLERQRLRAGGPGIQVLRVGANSATSGEYAVESNLLPFVLCAQILAVSALEPEDDAGLDFDGDYRSGLLRVQVDMNVGPKQRVFLLLNGSNRDTPDRIFRASRQSGVTQELTFPVRDLLLGEYLVRVQIDGAESPLQIDDQSRYAGPLLTVL